MRRLVLLDATLLATMIITSRAALVVHEAGGHALPAVASGATVVSMELSLFGGGWVWTKWPDGREPGVVFALGGIALNLLTGAAAWIVALRLRRGGLAHIALLFYGCGSVAHAVGYLGNGVYYDAGDPAGLAPRWTWMFAVPAMASVAFLAARSWLGFLAAHATVDSPRRRIAWTAATVGAVVFAYVALWTLTLNPRKEASLERIVVEQGRKVPPPIAPVALLAAGAVAAMVALWRTAPSAEPLTVRPVECLVATLLAAGCLVAITLFG